MEELTKAELSIIEVRLRDLITLVRKNIDITEGMKERTWGLILDKSAGDFNALYKTNIDLDDVYAILNAMKIFDHKVKP